MGKVGLVAPSLKVVTQSKRDNVCQGAKSDNNRENKCEFIPSFLEQMFQLLGRVVDP